MKRIEIIVSPAGQTRVETKGYRGADCRTASEFIEQALGERRGEQLTAEFHQSAVPQSIVSPSLRQQASE